MAEVDVPADDFDSDELSAGDENEPGEKAHGDFGGASVLRFLGGRGVISTNSSDI